MDKQYRIKTEQEFIDEFGNGGLEELNQQDCYFDKIFGSKLQESDFNVINEKEGVGYDMVFTINVYGDKRRHYFHIDKDMITDKPLPSVMSNFRIKTEKEFIDEFGEKWLQIINWNDNGLMDFLFGQEVGMNAEHIVEDWCIHENMITDKPLSTEGIRCRCDIELKEQFKVGDEVWIKGKIVKVSEDSGRPKIRIETIEEDFNDRFFDKNRVYKSIPSTGEFKVNSDISEQIESGKVDIKIDTAINRSLSATQKALESVQPQKASIMFGDSDLNYEDVDDHDLINGRTK